jgi:hypothetical protein
MFRSFVKYLVITAVFLHCSSVFSQEALPWFVRDTSYNEMLSQAVLFQRQADSLMVMAHKHRKEIMYMADSEKKHRLQVEVTRIEHEAEKLQSWADDIFTNLPVPGKPVVRAGVRDSLIFIDTVINDIRVYHYNLEALAEPREHNEVTARKKEPVLDEGLQSPADQFRILKESPYSAEKPFEHAFEMPGGPFYRIQLAAYGNPVAYDFFGGISPITTEVTGQGITRYFAGKFVSFGAAERAISQLRAAGYKDAFVVGYFNGQRMAPDRVLEYEKNNK